MWCVGCSQHKRSLHLPPFLAHSAFVSNTDQQLWRPPDCGFETQLAWRLRHVNVKCVEFGKWQHEFLPLILFYNDWVAGKRCGSRGVGVENRRCSQVMNWGAQRGLGVVAFDAGGQQDARRGEGVRGCRLRSPSCLFRVYLFICIFCHHVFVLYTHIQEKYFTLFHFILFHFCVKIISDFHIPNFLP